MRAGRRRARFPARFVERASCVGPTLAPSSSHSGVLASRARPNLRTTFLSVPVRVGRFAGLHFSSPCAPRPAQDQRFRSRAQPQLRTTTFSVPLRVGRFAGLRFSSPCAGQPSQDQRFHTRARPNLRKTTFSVPVCVRSVALAWGGGVVLFASCLHSVRE